MRKDIHHNGFAIFVISIFIIGFAVILPSQAQEIMPYSVRYKTIHTTAVYRDIDVKSPIINHIQPNVKGVILRWCLPEFPFGDFMLGGEQKRRQLLDERICEAYIEGKRYFIRGADITPDL